MNSNVSEVTPNWNFLSQSNKRLSGEDFISYLLRLRNIEHSNLFLKPPIESLHSNNILKNINKATSIVLNGLKQNKTFCIYFDVDCDGLTSGAIMYRYLSKCGANLSYAINEGKTHGLSHLTPNDIDDSVDILIIVDSIDSDYTIYKELNEKGIDIIILDHHDFDQYPNDAILVSSAQNYPNPELSGAGVVWKFCNELDNILHNNFSEDLLDLCAVGIISDICDVSEKSYENRYLCYRGLDNLKNLGLKTIIGNYEFNAKSILYSIAPLVNSAQRTRNNVLALELFLSDDETEIKSILKQLNTIKKQQDIIVADICQNVNDDINISGNNLNFIYSFASIKEYTGLIASIIADKYQKPTIIFYENGYNYRGSIRGYNIENFKSLINSTNLAESNGHEMAAGIICSKDNLDNFIQCLNNKIKNYKFNYNKDIDLLLNINEISAKMISHISLVNKIHGKNFAPINVALNNVKIDNPVLMQSKHVKFEFHEMEFIYWNNPSFYDLISEEKGYYKTIDLYGEVQNNYFAGKTKQQLIINGYKNITVLPDFLKRMQ